MADRREDEAGDQAGDDQQRGHGHERCLGRRVGRARRDRGSHRAEHRRRNVLWDGKRAPVAAAQSNQQAEDGRTEQQHAGALCGKRKKWSPEDDG